MVTCPRRPPEPDNSWLLEWDEAEQARLRAARRQAAAVVSPAPVRETAVYTEEDPGRWRAWLTSDAGTAWLESIRERDPRLHAEMVARRDGTALVGSPETDDEPEVAPMSTRPANAPRRPAPPPEVEPGEEPYPPADYVDPEYAAEMRVSAKVLAFCKAKGLSPVRANRDKAPSRSRAARHEEYLRRKARERGEDPLTPREERLFIKARLALEELGPSAVP